jgi:putative transposase
MPEYRRGYEPGGRFFFTLVTAHRRPIFLNPTARECLREAMLLVQSQRPFEIEAMVLLAEHLHCLWRLPEDDSDFSVRWACIKKAFTQRWLAAGGEEESKSKSRKDHRECGIWQRRFWEHTIRDERDWIAHMNYIHYNPVKHGLASCPHGWPYSTFERYVKEGIYEADWQCVCGGRAPQVIDFSEIQTSVRE